MAINPRKKDPFAGTDASVDSPYVAPVLQRPTPASAAPAQPGALARNLANVGAIVSPLRDFLTTSTPAPTDSMLARGLAPPPAIVSPTAPAAVTPSAPAPVGSVAAAPAVAIRRPAVPPAIAATQAATAAASDPATTLRSADGTGQGYFIGSGTGTNVNGVVGVANGVRRTVNADGTINGAAVQPVRATAGLAVQPGAVSTQPILARPDYAAPSTNLTGNTYAADQERKAAIAQLDNQLGNLGQLNSRGKRQFAAEVLGLKRDLTGAAFNQAGDLTKAGAEINARGGEAALGADSAYDRTAAELANSSNENRLNRQFQFDNSGSPQLGADGKLYLQRGGSVTPVTGADGKPFSPAVTKAQGAVTEADQTKALNDAATEILKGVVPGPQGYTADQIAQARAQAQQLVGGGTKSVVREGTDTKTGKRVRQYSDGSVEVVN